MFNLKQLISDSHFRLALAFIVVFIGTVYKPLATVCNLLASYLGCTIVVSAGKAAMAEKE